MKLKEYIEKNFVCKTRLAKRVGLSYLHIYHITKNVNPVVPNLKTAVAIELATHGAVRVIDFLTEEDMDELKRLGLYPIKREKKSR